MHTIFADDELPEGMTQEEAQETLDAIDRAWEVPQERLDGMQELFYQKLAAKYPGHPFLKGSDYAND